jgi:hypothetical protein
MERVGRAMRRCEVERGVVRGGVMAGAVAGCFDGLVVDVWSGRLLGFIVW